MDADSVFYGNVITIDPRRPKAEAVAVKDGKIVYVGSKKIAKSYIGSKTKVVDYGKNSIYPGFIDAHAHAGGGVFSLFNKTNVGAVPLEEALEVMRKEVENNPGQEFYAFWGLVEVPGKPLTKQMLDKICPDAPLAINGSCGHSLWLNSKAIEFIGLDKSLAKELGTDQVELDENGELNGALRENGVMWAEERIPHSKEETADFYRWWQSNYFSYGYTGGGDAGLFERKTPMISAWSEVTKDPDWRLRVFGFMEFRSEYEGDIAEMIKEFAGYRDKYENDYLKFPSVKSFMDGVIEGHTGWLIDEYDDQAGYYGVKRLDNKEKLVKIIEEADKNGFSMHIHSIGDGATKAALDAIEQAIADTGNADQRNALCHLHLVRPEDIQRMADLNVTAVTPPIWTEPSPELISTTVKYIGMERTKRTYPIASFVRAGANMVFHTDSVIFGIPLSIVMAVTRAHPKGGCEPLDANECTTRMDAIKAMTINVAYMWKQEDRLGSLEVGKLADMSVFHCDFLEDDIEKIADDTPVATIVNGDIVYSAE